MKKNYHIVWNDSRTEGFITDDSNDAVTASTGDRLSFATSTVGEAFYEAYSGDADVGDYEFTIQDIEIDAPPALNTKE